MTRSSFPATTASGDAVTLEAATDAASRTSSRGRVLAQLEHNAMHALSLVRAGLLALQGVTRSLDAATQLLSHHHGVLDPGVAKELRQVIDALSQHVQMAAHEGHPLLSGAHVMFALDDPWHRASQPLQVDLPDLGTSVLGAGGLEELELGARARPTVLPVLQRLSGARSAVQQGQDSMQRAAQQLNVVLTRLHADRAKGAAARNPADTFEHLAERVRDHVLRGGASALRVQGAPSTRAAWLVEGFDEGV